MQHFVDYLGDGGNETLKKVKHQQNYLRLNIIQIVFPGHLNEINKA